MTRALDRYILHSFLYALVMALLAFIAIFVILDLFEKLDDFLDRDVPVAIILHYYVYRIPEILLLMLPVGMLLASLFSLGAFARNNEFTAVIAAGISMRRTLAPVLLVSFVISAAALLLGEAIAPPAAERVNKIKEEVIKPGSRRAGRTRSNLSFLGDEGRLFWIGRLEPALGRVENIVIQRLVGNTLVERLDAEEGTWEEGVWTFRNGYYRRFTGESLVEAAPFSERIEREIGETPEDLAKIQKNSMQMSYRELSDHIDRLESGGADVQKEKVDLHMKIAFPFTSFLIVLLGSPLAALLNRSGNALGFTLALMICFVYYMAIRVGQSFGYNEVLPPLPAAWAGNILFSLVGIILFRRLGNR